MTTFDRAETDRLLSTTRAVRKRLDFERPVDRDVLLECLRLAVQAPTGSNAQGWRWLFVDDPDIKHAIAELYRAAGGDYFQLAQQRGHRRSAVGPGHRLRRLSRRQPRACAGVAHPVHRRPSRQRQADRGRLVLGLDPACGVELPARAAGPRSWEHVHHAASRVRAPMRRDPRHPPRIHAGRASAHCPHAGHRLRCRRFVHRSRRSCTGTDGSSSRRVAHSLSPAGVGVPAPTARPVSAEGPLSQASPRFQRLIALAPDSRARSRRPVNGKNA